MRKLNLKKQYHVSKKMPIQDLNLYPSVPKANINNPCFTKTQQNKTLYKKKALTMSQALCWASLVAQMVKHLPAM